ncbi:unnamed protein product [Rhizophagus irregularis]|uniref:Uncharacterized protein n=2 Tax=Rhizophagus irregularis TaxID=588596 RepID=A0A915Z7F3_9GLOM|nr:unnamed protein product [Rhizophagus irregularis]
MGYRTNNLEGMSKFNKCSLQMIPETNLGMDLVGEELCQYHYNKLIVNENHRLARAMKKQQCAHPKHKEYTKDNEIG